VERLFGGALQDFPGPLCLVTPGGRAAILDDLADRGTAAGWTVLVRDGEALGREAVTAVAGEAGRRRRLFSDPQLVVVQRFDAIGGPERQAAVRQLLDGADRTTWCLAIERHPLAGHLIPDLAARIAGGLTITVAAGESASAGHGGISSERPADPPGPRPKVAAIVAATGRQLGISVAELRGPGRSRSVARARCLAIYLARSLTTASFATIGRALGGRDHTTAMHSARVARARLATDPGFAADSRAILASLAGGSRRQPATSLSIP